MGKRFRGHGGGGGGGKGPELSSGSHFARVSVSARMPRPSITSATRAKLIKSTDRRAFSLNRIARATSIGWVLKLIYGRKFARTRQEVPTFCHYRAEFRARDLFSLPTISRNSDRPSQATQGIILKVEATDPYKENNRCRDKKLKRGAPWPFASYAGKRSREIKNLPIFSRIEVSVRGSHGVKHTVMIKKFRKALQSARLRRGENRRAEY